MIMMTVLECMISFPSECIGQRTANVAYRFSHVPLAMGALMAMRSALSFQPGSATNHANMILKLPFTTNTVCTI